jgi:hypothetical protein
MAMPVLLIAEANLTGEVTNTPARITLAAQALRVMVRLVPRHLTGHSARSGVSGGGRRGRLPARSVTRWMRGRQTAPPWRGV